MRERACGLGASALASVKKEAAADFEALRHAHFPKDKSAQAHSPPKPKAAPPPKKKQRLSSWVDEGGALLQPRSSWV